MWLSLSDALLHLCLHQLLVGKQELDSVHPDTTVTSTQLIISTKASFTDWGLKKAFVFSTLTPGVRHRERIP